MKRIIEIEKHDEKDEKYRENENKNITRVSILRKNFESPKSLKNLK